MVDSGKVFCIDIGNTRTHCATVSIPKNSIEGNTHTQSLRKSFKVLSSTDYPTSDFSSILADEALSPLKNEAKDIEAIIYCSVVPKASAKLESFLLASDFSDRFFNLNSDTSPISLDVKIPAQVGQDRIADAIAASLFFEPPYIVVDMGTAVTIDLVNSKGAYSGGAIAPGLHAFTSYLSERAAQLPEIDLLDESPIPDVGRDTVEAMRVGCVKGFWKLAEGIISDIEKSFFGGCESLPRTVFTGGSLSLLPKNWLSERIVESNLAPLGLAYFYFLTKLKNNGLRK